jgi:hypothetical protein
MLFRDLTIEATYNAVSAKEKIRYYSRPEWTARGGRRFRTNENGNPLMKTEPAN